MCNFELKFFRIESIMISHNANAKNDREKENNPPLTLRVNFKSFASLIKKKEEWEGAISSKSEINNWWCFSQNNCLRKPSFIIMRLKGRNSTTFCNFRKTF